MKTNVHNKNLALSLAFMTRFTAPFYSFIYLLIYLGFNLQNRSRDAFPFCCFVSDGPTLLQHSAYRLDCEQSLFCSKIREEKVAEHESRASGEAASSALPCVTRARLLFPRGFPSKRETARSLLTVRNRHRSRQIDSLASRSCWRWGRSILVPSTRSVGSRSRGSRSICLRRH